MQINTDFKNKIVYIVSIFFLITGTALVLHHHDIPLKFAGCTICKIKNSLTGPQNRNVMDAVFAVTDNFSQMVELLPASAELIRDQAFCAPSSVHLLIDLNKSPPPSLT
jgi:hypothetical protein